MGENTEEFRSVVRSKIASAYGLELVMNEKKLHCGLKFKLPGILCSSLETGSLDLGSSSAVWGPLFFSFLLSPGLIALYIFQNDSSLQRIGLSGFMIFASLFFIMTGVGILAEEICSWNAVNLARGMIGVMALFLYFNGYIEALKCYHSDETVIMKEYRSMGVGIIGFMMLLAFVYLVAFPNSVGAFGSTGIMYAVENENSNMPNNDNIKKIEAKIKSINRRNSNTSKMNGAARTKKQGVTFSDRLVEHKYI